MRKKNIPAPDLSEFDRRVLAATEHCQLAQQIVVSLGLDYTAANIAEVLLSLQRLRTIARLMQQEQQASR